MLDIAVNIAGVLYLIGIVLMETNMVSDLYVAVAALIIAMILAVISVFEES